MSACFTSWAQNASPTPYYRWTTLAGHPTTGYADGPAAEALFNNPSGLAVDTNDNIYVADTANHVIRKITPAGVVSTLAGSPGNPGSVDGTGSAARFTFPKSLEIDAAGNVYVADIENQAYRKITPSGEVTTIENDFGESADGTIRRITANGIVEIDTTLDLDDPVFYENGQPSDAVTTSIGTVDWNGNLYIVAGIGRNLYGTNPNGPRFRRIIKRSTDGTYAILASSEYGSGYPYLSDSVSIIRWAHDAFGNTYYVTRLVSSIIVHEVYRINPNGVVEGASWRPAGRGGYEDAPVGLSADSHGHMLHTAETDDVVFKTTGNELQVLAGTLWSNQGTNGTGAAARFAGISELTVDQNSQLLIGEANFNYLIHPYRWFTLKQVSMTGDTTTLYTGRAVERSAQPVVRGIVTNGSGNIFFGHNSLGPAITERKPDGSTSNVPLDLIREITDLALATDGKLIAAERNRVTRQSTTDQWTVIAGDETVAEIKDDAGAAAHFYLIRSMTATGAGDIYVLDDASQSATPRSFIRKIAPNHVVTTVSDNLVLDGGAWPKGMNLDAKGDFVLTYSDDTIRLLTSDGTLHTIGGQSGLSGTRDGAGNEARFYILGRVTTDAGNNIYVSDNAGVTIRKGEFLGFNATIKEQPQSLTVEAGATAEFSVLAQGTPEPSYQWYFNDAAISGATSSTLTITNAQTTNAGSYTVTVSNSLGTVTSSEAILTVTTPNTPPPPDNGGENNGGDSNPPPSSSGNSSAGGGGSPSLWFVAALAALGFVRRAMRFTAA